MRKKFTGNNLQFNILDTFVIKDYGSSEYFAHVHSVAGSAHRLV